MDEANRRQYMSHTGGYCALPGLEQSARPKQDYGWVTFYMGIILLTQNNYTVDCQLTAREKGTSGLERTVALMASEPWAKAVKCNPGDGGKSLAGACYAQKTIAVKK